MNASFILLLLLLLLLSLLFIEGAIPTHYILLLKDIHSIFLNDQTFHFAQASSPYVQITGVVVNWGISNAVVLEIP